MILKKPNKKAILIVALAAFITFSLYQKLVVAPPQCNQGAADTCCNTGTLWYYNDCEGCGYVSMGCSVCHAYTTKTCSYDEGGSICSGSICSYVHNSISDAACTNVPIMPCSTGNNKIQDKCTGSGTITDHNICRGIGWDPSCNAPTNCNGVLVNSYSSLCSYGVAQRQDFCSSACDISDGTCESGCGAISQCDEQNPGYDITPEVCNLGGTYTYFADECSSTCGAQDKDNICRSSGSGCTAPANCNGVTANSYSSLCSYGVAQRQDFCSSACDISDGTCSSGCGAITQCNGQNPGYDITPEVCNLGGQTFYADECSSTCGAQDKDNICRSSGSGCTADLNCNGLTIDAACGGTGHYCNSVCGCECKPPPGGGDWYINSVCTVTDKTYTVTGNIYIQGSGLLELRGTTNIIFSGLNRYIYVYSGGQIHIYNTAGFNK